MEYKYPYTDFNEYNLDWVIVRIKELTEQWAAYQEQMNSDWIEFKTGIEGEWSDVQADWRLTRNAFEDLRNYVNSFFDNLDVQQEINHKLDEMASDGTLTALLQPYIPNAVAAWLSEHVNPQTGYVVDNTLTIAGAAADAKATGDRIAAVKSEADDTESMVLEKETKTLPVYLFGKYKVVLPAGKVLVCGTESVAELLELYQGTYTANGLTITVSGTEMTVSGTAEANTIIDLKTGEVSSNSGLAALSLGLPEHDYTLITTPIYQNATYYPTIFSRNKNNTGNIFLSQANAAAFTMDSTTCGGLGISFTANRQYDFKWNIALATETVGNGWSHRLESSDVTVYDYSATYDLNGYTWSDGNPTVTMLKSKLPKRPLLKYSTRAISYTGAQEVVDIYLPSKDGYIDYIFGHTVSGVPQDQGGGNVWRLIQITKVNEEFVREYYITTLGETEMALRLDGRSDFIGGYTHGDEYLNDDSLLITIDGNTVDISDYPQLTPFTELSITTTATMYDPDDHTTIVGQHGVNWIFTEDGLDLNQTVQFAGDFTLKASYLPMVCAIRDTYSSQSLQITDTYFDNGNYKLWDISESGFTTYPAQLKNVSKLNLTGERCGVKIEIELIKQPEGIPGEGNFIYNDPQYNKMYNAICGYPEISYQVTAETFWFIESKIRVFGNEITE